MTDNRYRTAVNPVLSLGMLLCLWVFMLVVTSLLSLLLFSAMGQSAASLRVQAILQDVLVFILPPVVTALLTSRYPAELLEVMRGPKFTTTVYAIAALLCSIPAMEMVIAWNDGWQLPEALRWARELEEQARETTELMMSGTSVGSLVISVLIVGVFTGIAEELFFRGGVQKLLMCTRLNPHAAIWIAAVIFSVMHLQVYGLVPRILLGAFFGYAMWWSGSLWLPMLLHALNNSLVVVTQWMAARGDIAAAEAQSTSPIAIAVSVALTAIAIYLTIFTRVRDKSRANFGQKNVHRASGGQTMAT